MSCCRVRRWLLGAGNRRDLGLPHTASTESRAASSEVFLMVFHQMSSAQLNEPRVEATDIMWKNEELSLEKL